MKSHKPLLSALTAAALLFAGSLIAQDAPPPPPAPAASMASPAPTERAAYPTPQGQVIVHSTPAPAPVINPAPSFEQLSGGGKWISEDQAAAYPPLANDFLNASHNGKRVSKAQYDNWVKQLQ
jgi:hypothetical protein